MTTFTITVSRPCAALRSNGGHGNKFAINRARQGAKDEAMLLTLQASHGFTVPHGAVLGVRYTEVLGPRQRAMDDDNLIGAMKPYRDGIALALGINDKRMVTHKCGEAERGEVGGVKVCVWWEEES